MKPLVSIITVVYNGAATLEDTIRSVIEQEFRDLEMVIVDGGSKDATLDVIRKYENNGLPLRWISEPDKGVYDAMNKGIRLAEGEWLYFLGSDDRFQDREVLRQTFSTPSFDSYDLLYGDVLSPSFKGRYDGEFSYEKLLSRNLSHQAAFYKKALFTRLGEYDLRYRMHADWDFNLRCFADPSTRTRYTGVLVASFGEGGISAGHDLSFLRERLIPAKLQWLHDAGLQSLRRIRLYDEWWRFLRNAGFRDKAIQGRVPLPQPLTTMLSWQRSVPASALKNGFLSKIWMFSSYLFNRPRH
ncbi:MAG: glycosyltransferase [Bacteroidetes bacterium]|nr:glycosyltransferase [Bacteroidota bacterium]